MASSPDILDELPWLRPTPRKTFKAQALRHGRSALILGALAAPLLIANGHFGWSSGDQAQAPGAAATPAVIDSPFAPKALRPLSPLEAEKWNSAIPQAGAVTAATPFSVVGAAPQSLSRSLQCMTQAIYYEAGNEPVDGQRAVAQVILNRMRSPVFPHSVCGVVYQGSERKTGCQFTFTCDGSLARVPSAGGWARASAVAAAALGGYVYAPVGWATNYHADYVVPYWASSLDKLTTIGRHIFYGWKGRSGSGAGFTSHYAGSEPDVVAGAGLLAAAPAATLTDPSGGIVRVTSAERPMIGFGEAPAADAGGAKSKAAASDVQHPTVALGARWVIGGSNQSGTSRYTARTVILPAGEEPKSPAGEVAKADVAAAPKQDAATAE